MGQDARSPRGPRCIALVGPFQSGKTTLLEAILARTGAVQRQGTVDAGTTVGDASKEARHHKMSVEATFATTNFMGDSYTFVDCPGSIEFIQDMPSVLPAVDVGKSVSRVGGKAQWAAYRAVAGDLKLAYAQFEELETFARFGARLDDDTRKIIEHGRRIRACLKQAELAPMPVPAQIAVLLALSAGLFDAVPLEHMDEAQRAVLEAAAQSLPADVSQRLLIAHQLSDADRGAIIELARRALAAWPTASPA